MCLWAPAHSGCDLDQMGASSWMMPSVDRARRKRVIRVVQTSLSALVLVAIFGLILPQIASYADVWATIRALTWIEMISLIAATVFNLFTYWWQMQSAMPGSRSDRRR